MNDSSASNLDPQAPSLEDRGVATIKGIAMDGPHAAQSGHQGTAMALAPLAHVLYTRIMKYNAAAPLWPDRDRFILSCGHASILQYAMLHLTGFGLSKDDLRNFRQWGSLTPGHPEVGHTDGVEVTTGPLGAGFANGVGMAMAESWLRAEFGSEVTDHHTFVMCSDGDLAEGVSHEAASLAGHLGLGHLVCIYDLNRISIDGETDMWLSDDPIKRFESYNWHVVDLGETANDLDALEAGLRNAMAVTDQPTLLILRSHIGAPSPTLSDTAAAHGYAFKDAEIAETKAILGLPTDEPFHVAADVLEMYRAAGARGAAEHAAWEKRLADWDGDRDRLLACLNRTGLDGWADALPQWEAGESIATRKASGACIAAIAPLVPGMVSGSADLTGNTGNVIPGATALSASTPNGRQMYYGVREHAMISAMNGAALHGGVLPVGGTFLVFSDYCRPAIRLAALSKAKIIMTFTHDSVGVGEDGPTHQPVEHVTALRAIPDLRLLRPADANETAAAWKVAVESDGPTMLVLTRQNLPVLEGTSVEGVARGGYELVGAEDAQLTLLSAGSEVSLCVEAARRLAEDGIAARVVSMPSWDLFLSQDAEYQKRVLTGGPVLAVEAGVTDGWYRWADDVVGIDRFGASAPGSTVMHELGINADNVVSRARTLIS